MNAGVWQEDARSELPFTDPRDYPTQPVKTYDGRNLIPALCFVAGAFRYTLEIQFAPPADALAVKEI